MQFHIEYMSQEVLAIYSTSQDRLRLIEDVEGFPIWTFYRAEPLHEHEIVG